MSAHKKMLLPQQTPTADIKNAHVHMQYLTKGPSRGVSVCV